MSDHRGLSLSPYDDQKDKRKKYERKRRENLANAFEELREVLESKYLRKNLLSRNAVLQEAAACLRSLCEKKEKTQGTAAWLANKVTEIPGLPEVVAFVEELKIQCAVTRNTEDPETRKRRRTDCNIMHQQVLPVPLYTSSPSNPNNLSSRLPHLHKTQTDNNTHQQPPTPRPLPRRPYTTTGTQNALFVSRFLMNFFVFFGLCYFSVYSSYTIHVDSSSGYTSRTLLGVHSVISTAWELSGFFYMACGVFLGVLFSWLTSGPSKIMINKARILSEQKTSTNDIHANIFSESELSDEGLAYLNIHFPQGYSIYTYVNLIAMMFEFVFHVLYIGEFFVKGMGFVTGKNPTRKLAAKFLMKKLQNPPDEGSYTLLQHLYCFIYLVNTAYTTDKITSSGIFSFLALYFHSPVKSSFVSNALISRAWSYTPKSAKASSNLLRVSSLSLFAQGQWKSAMTIARVIEANQDTSAGQIIRASAYCAQGRTKHVVDVLKQPRGDVNEQTIVHRHLLIAYAHIHKGDTAKALEVLKDMAPRLTSKESEPQFTDIIYHSLRALLTPTEDQVAKHKCITAAVEIINNKKMKIKDVDGLLLGMLHILVSVAGDFHTCLETQIKSMKSCPEAEGIHDVQEEIKQELMDIFDFMKNFNVPWLSGHVQYASGWVHKVNGNESKALADWERSYKESERFGLKLLQIDILSTISKQLLNFDVSVTNGRHGMFYGIRYTDIYNNIDKLKMSCDISSSVGAILVV